MDFSKEGDGIEMLIALCLAHAAYALDPMTPLRAIRVHSTFTFPNEGVASLVAIEGESDGATFTTHLTFQFENENQRTIAFAKTLDGINPIQELTYAEMLDSESTTFVPLDVDFDDISAKNGIFDLSPEHILQRLALEVRQPITLTREDKFLNLSLGVCTLFERAPSKLKTRTIAEGQIVFTAIDIYYLKTAEIETQPVLTLYQDESTNVGLRCQPKSGWGLFESLEDLIDSTKSQDPVEWSLGRKHAES